MHVMIYEKENLTLVVIEPESHDSDFRLVLSYGIHSTFSLTNHSTEKYFKGTEPEQMWETIEKALEKYFQKGAVSV